MRISLCVGEYAEIPYLIPGLETEAYCAEELCYCIKENAFLLDITFMDDGLLDWFDKQCGLRELSRQLYPLIHKRGSLSLFVVTILQYVGFYDAETIAAIERTIKNGAGLSPIEKRKKQIDYLLSKKKYNAAMEGYEILIRSWKEKKEAGEELPPADCLAGIWNNKGIALAGMLFFQQSAQCFLEAYHIAEKEEFYLEYLAAKRLHMGEQEYVNMVSGQKEHYETTLKLEKRMEESMREWEQQPECFFFRQNQDNMNSEEKQRFLQDREKMTIKLMDCYREYAKMV